jgi:hypothetical protein
MENRRLEEAVPSGADPTPAPALFDRIGFAGFIVAVLFFAFLGGGITVLADVFPARAMKDAYRGARAYYDKMVMSESPFLSGYWKTERTARKGVTVNEPEAQPGYTLYSSGHGTVAYLVALDGTVVHEWRLPFSAIYDPERLPIKTRCRMTSCTGTAPG